jgi:hypothetical protein
MLKANSKSKQQTANSKKENSTHVFAGHHTDACKTIVTPL